MKFWLVLLCFWLCVASAQAQQTSRFDFTDFYRLHAIKIAQSPVILAALRAQNIQRAGITPAEIAALEAAWQAAGHVDSAPIRRAVLHGPAADYLRHHKDASGGTIIEIFVMDAQGLTVAAAEATSDLWQGDEAKFTESFGKGRGAIHVGPVSLDGSTGVYATQISVSVVDPENGRLIGAITLGISATSLSRSAPGVRQSCKIEQKCQSHVGVLPVPWRNLRFMKEYTHTAI